MLWDIPLEAGGAAPNAREISDIVMAQQQEFVPNWANLNENVQFFGQFYTHDQAAARGGDGSERIQVAGIPTPALRRPEASIGTHSSSTATASGSISTT